MYFNVERGEFNPVTCGEVMGASRRIVLPFLTSVLDGNG